MGSLLRHLVPFAFRAAHQQLGEELIPLYDPTALISVLEPELFTWEAMAGAVETQGNRTRGMTVFDQRPSAQLANEHGGCQRGGDC